MYKKACFYKRLPLCVDTIHIILKYLSISRVIIYKLQAVRRKCIHEHYRCINCFLSLYENKQHRNYFRKLYCTLKLSLLRDYTTFCLYLYVVTEISDCYKSATTYPVLLYLFYSINGSSASKPRTLPSGLTPSSLPQHLHDFSILYININHAQKTCWDLQCGSLNYSSAYYYIIPTIQLQYIKAGKWVPFCCTLGGGVDLGLGYLYKHFYELYLQNNLQIFMILTNFCQNLNFKCFNIYDLYYLNNNKYQKSFEAKPLFNVVLTTYKKPCIKFSTFSGQPKNFYRYLKRKYLEKLKISIVYK
ncbi:hypothetical protein AGLY_000236 [Aphis glycines]|uniref:Uncharacterized protein n=1 Tax=Aphis glycines TaxID=307491 RepID=A0A6G0U6J4_APHGL|nr:hypothetical protein AGLY_000236 [Aphis glycines]